MYPKMIVLFALSVFLFTTDVSSHDDGYVGCFKDNAKVRAMPWNGFTKSVGECLKRCEAKNQPYAGLQFGKDCYCGTFYDKYGTSTGCNKKCKSGQMCGGFSINSVYHVHLEESEKPEYIGCFKDNAKVRAMPPNGLTISVEECVERCKSKNQPYAGLQFGKGCYCGTTYSKYGRSTGCKNNCQSGQMCGGYSINSVYKVDFQESHKPEYIGCFKDHAIFRAMPWSGFTKSIQECVDMCDEKDQPYAGLQRGKSCYCGTYYDKYGMSDGCKDRCKSGGICGGYSINSVYKVDLDASDKPEYIGCFNDNANVRAMPRYGFAKSVSECVKRCEAKKQPYAGLQFGRECYCGTFYDKYGRSNRCRNQCRSGQICGGLSINSVYKVDLQETDKPEYIGCFKDNAIVRAMPPNGLTKSVEECVERCKSKNQPYAGLQFGKGCYCGTTYSKYGRSTGCKNNCQSGQMCGGYSINSVYKVDLEESHKPEYIGCFKDHAIFRAMPWSGFTKSIQECVDMCDEKDQPYAGLQRGKSCYCGTYYDKYGMSDGCKDRCKSGGICGGYSINSVYKVDLDASDKPEYIGCFNDNANVRAMPRYGFAKSVSECVKRCEAKKQPYAGLQFGRECYCGTFYDKYGRSNRCRNQCRSGQICGGLSINSVYKVDLQETDKPEYIGCFKDNAIVRAMPPNGLTKSVEECVERCKSKNQPYAGLQFGKGCYCGTTYSKYGRSTGCKNNCQSGQMCGGYSINSVYKVDLEESHKPEYIGCFEDHAIFRAMPWSGFTKSIQECVDMCDEKDQPYAGLQRGKSCYCGTYYDKYGMSDGCKDRCKSGGICGGYSINSVYKVDLDASDKPEYIGCFNDNAKVRAMPRYGFAKSVSECVKRCEAKKQPYAGLQFGGECYCGTFYDKYGRSTGCRNQCRSDQICGGFSINSVYKVDLQETDKPEYIGCFNDNVEFRAMQWSGYTKSVEECLNMCDEKDQPYAGLQYGNGCYCGTQYAKYGRSTGCNKKCQSGQMCGGFVISSVYHVH